MSFFKAQVSIGDAVIPLPPGAYGDKKGTVIEIIPDKLVGEGRWKSLVSSTATVHWNDGTTTEIPLWAISPNGVWSDSHRAMQIN